MPLLLSLSRQEELSSLTFALFSSTMAPSAWGMDVIGPMILKASNGHEYILVAIYYFTKWVETASYNSIT